MTVCPRCRLQWGRSDAEHQTLFGVISMCWENWPESFPFQPNSTEQLRGWLAIRVGHSTTLALPEVRGMTTDTARQIADGFTEGKQYYEANPVGRSVHIVRPRTMQKTAMHVKEFRQMATKVYEVIEQITGITPSIYKANKEHGDHHDHDKRENEPQAAIRVHEVA